MKKYLLITMLVALISGCASKPVLKNLPDDAIEKPINSPEQIDKIIQKND